MTSATYRVARLTSDFDLGHFDCGAPAYNEWLTGHALAAISAGSSAAYLLLETDHTTVDRVVGYYDICPTSVVRTQVPKPWQHGILRAAPGWLLAKFALDTSLRGDKQHRWGSQLLRDALETIVASADAGGGQIVVVDADNAGLLGWYVRHGFRSTGGDELRLYMKVATARQHLQKPDNVSHSAPG